MVYSLDRLDRELRADVATNPEVVLLGPHEVERFGGRLGVEGRAVVELDALAQGEAPGGRVGLLPLGGQLRHQLAGLRVAVEQRLVDVAHDLIVVAGGRVIPRQHQRFFADHDRDGALGRGPGRRRGGGGRRPARRVPRLGHLRLVGRAPGRSWGGGGRTGQQQAGQDRQRDGRPQADAPACSTWCFSRSSRGAAVPLHSLLPH